VAWTCSDPSEIQGSNAPAAGVLTLAEFFVRGGAPTISTIAVYVGTAGSSLTSSENFAGIYNSSGTLKGSTADQTTAWGTTGLKSMALTSAFTSIPAGRYYLAILSNGTTPPAFRAPAAVPNLANAGLSGANLRYAAYSSSLTALPGTITMASLVTSNAMSIGAVLY
jgi:hypothetical protein